MEYTTLNNNKKMPLVGFGVYQIADLKQCEEAVSNALSVGYRSLDTAQSYLNEKAVGNAIANSGIKREDIFLTTKLWVENQGEDNALRAIENSLKRLKTDYLDLFLIHQPFGDYYGSWRAMEKLYKEVVLKAIGISNFYPDRFIDLYYHAQIKPMVNQIEVNPYFQRYDVQALLNEFNTTTEAWAPFAEGKNKLFENPTINQIAQKHGKTAAQVVLRWLTQRNIVVLPKSTHKERMQENIDIFNFKLDEDDISAIKTLDIGKSQFFSHSDPEIAKWMCTRKLHIDD